MHGYDHGLEDGFASSMDITLARYSLPYGGITSGKEASPPPVLFNSQVALNYKTQQARKSNPDQPCQRSPGNEETCMGYTKPARPAHYFALYLCCVSLHQQSLHSLIKSPTTPPSL